MGMGYGGLPAPGSFYVDIENSSVIQLLYGISVLGSLFILYTTLLSTVYLI